LVGADRPASAREPRVAVGCVRRSMFELFAFGSERKIWEGRSSVALSA
jgi:hypothetical protein